jgi:glucosamine-phosphate N-acetyltransferase
MIIRPMERRDLTRGFAEALSGLAEVDLNLARLLDVFDTRRRQGIVTFVAVENDQVLGTASLLVEQKFIHSGGKVGHVEDVAVNPTFRARGVGRALVDHLVGEARRRGCYKVILNCADYLVGFYAAAGFREASHGMRQDLAGSSAEVAVVSTARSQVPA